MIALADNKPDTDRLLDVLSASRLTTWLGCRLKFYFRYVLELPKPATPALVVGKAVHAALQSWNMRRWKGEPEHPDILQTSFERVWKEETEGDVTWESDDEREASKQTAYGLVETYLAQTPIPKDEIPEAVEVAVEADLMRLTRLVGIIDLVRQGGRIVDFKTARSAQKPEMAAHLNGIQLTAYSLLYRATTDRKESARELHHILKLKQPKVVITTLPPASDAEVTRLAHLAEAYLDGVERQDFVPSPGLQCAMCEFFNECARWK
jgi:putative RecB family exonuclease